MMTQNAPIYGMKKKRGENAEKPAVFSARNPYKTVYKPDAIPSVSSPAAQDQHSSLIFNNGTYRLRTPRQMTFRFLIQTVFCIQGAVALLPENFSWSCFHMKWFEISKHK
jgi:hypothetical protein